MLEQEVRVTEPVELDVLGRGDVVPFGDDHAVRVGRIGGAPDHDPGLERVLAVIGRTTGRDLCRGSVDRSGHVVPVGVTGEEILVLDVAVLVKVDVGGQKRM